MLELARQPNKASITHKDIIAAVGTFKPQEMSRFIWLCHCESQISWLFTKSSDLFAMICFVARNWLALKEKEREKFNKEAAKDK